MSESDKSLLYAALAMLKHPDNERLCIIRVLFCRKMM